MKITPIKIAATAIVLISLSFASCRSAGYGCDYGAVGPNIQNTYESEICYEEKKEEKEVTVTYTRIDDVSE